MLSSVWITDTTINERIEHQQSGYGQEADHLNNLLASLIRLESNALGLLVRLGRRIRAMPQKTPQKLRMLRYRGAVLSGGVRPGLAGDLAVRGDQVHLRHAAELGNRLAGVRIGDGLDHQPQGLEVVGWI